MGTLTILPFSFLLLFTLSLNSWIYVIFQHSIQHSTHPSFPPTSCPLHTNHGRKKSQPEHIPSPQYNQDFTTTVVNPSAPHFPLQGSWSLSKVKNNPPRRISGNPQNCCLNWMNSIAHKICRVSTSNPCAIQLSVHHFFCCLSRFCMIRICVRKHLAFVRSQSTNVALWLKLNPCCYVTKFMSKKAEVSTLLPVRWHQQAWRLMKLPVVGPT